VEVSVLRTPFDIDKAPFSVARVSARDATQARPGLALDEVLGRVAGVQVDNRLNFAVGERLSIRGQGARAQFGVRGVRVIVDDIPATLADGQQRSIMSISHPWGVRKCCEDRPPRYTGMLLAEWSFWIARRPPTRRGHRAFKRSGGLMDLCALILEAAARLVMPRIR
jgi:hypothetical protein